MEYADVLDISTNPIPFICNFWAQLGLIFFAIRLVKVTESWSALQPQVGHWNCKRLAIVLVNFNQNAWISLDNLG
jgi:hypothetical protein